MDAQRVARHHESLPAVTVALIVTLGERRELFPLYDHDLLVDAAVIALRNAVDDARREADPVASEIKAEEAIVLSCVLRRLIPEIRELLKSRIPVLKEQVLVQ